MAKKKKKNTDFQKVKLKVGRHVRKAANLTDTSFKAKKVKLKQQFKHDVSNMQEHQPLSIEELLNRLSHHNVHSRYDALMNIKKYVLNSSKEQNNIIISHLPLFVKKLGDNLLDSEASIRKSVFNVLSSLLHMVQSSRLKPVFHILSSYVFCAATHIKSDIRRDSIKFISMMLDVFPSSLYFTEEFLQIFIELISYQKEKPGIEIPNVSRALTINPDEKITSQEWRVQVLDCLIKYLEGGISDGREDKNKEMNSMCKVVMNGDGPLYVSIYSPGGLEPVLPPLYSVYDSINFSGRVAKHEFVQKFISDIMPLLYDIWVESSPHHFLSSGATQTLKTESVLIMLAVTRVIACMVEWIDLNPDNYSKWFKERYSSSISRYFLTSFPYSVKISSRENNAVSGKNLCIKINLYICKFFVFVILGTDECSSHIEDNVLRYLLYVMNSGNLEDTNVLLLLIEIIQKSLCFANEEFSCCLLQELFSHYDKLHTNQKAKLLNFFIDFALNLKFKTFMKYDFINLWLQHLPFILKDALERNPLDNSLLDDVRKIYIRGYPAFLEGAEKTELRTLIGR